MGCLPLKHAGERRFACVDFLRNAAQRPDRRRRHDGGKASRVIGVISVLPGEGKSTVAAKSGGLLAANGAKTLLIDGDLRNPGLSRCWRHPRARYGGGPGRPGAVAVRCPGRPEDEAGHPARPRTRSIRAFLRAALLAQDAAHRRCRQGEIRLIVVDLPPLGPVVDAKAFAQMVDGFLLVTEWGRPRATWSVHCFRPSRKSPARCSGCS